MDTTMIATLATTLLTPVLPYLLKGGEKAMEEAGKKVGGDAWDKAKAVWAKLFPKIEDEPAALEAAQEAAQAPADEEARERLRSRLEAILDDDQALARQIFLTINDSSVKATARGDRSSAFAGDADRSQIIAGSSLNITGDGNVVGQNNYSSVNKLNAASEPATLKGFGELLRQLRAELLEADLDYKMRRSIETDIQAVEAEAKDSNPSLPIIESKLRGVESMLKLEGGAGAEAQTLTPLIRKAIELAGRLFT